MELITAKNLAKTYANGHGLKSASFTIRAGEFVGVVGQSGVGKTTLMRLLCGAIFPTSGELSIFGIDMRSVSRSELYTLRRRVAAVYQHHNVIPCLDVTRNVLLGRLASASWFETIRRITFPGQLTEEFYSILESLQIADKIDERCQELSGGQQQRVAIARALALKPDILCFDEPTSALDPELTGEVLKVIRGLAQQRTTMVIVTHEMAFARDVADRIIFMDEGVIVEEGPAYEVIEHPKQERTKQFLSRYTES